MDFENPFFAILDQIDLVGFVPVFQIIFISDYSDPDTTKYII